MSHLMLLTKTSETPLTETLESATEMLQTSARAAGGAGRIPWVIMILLILVTLLSVIVLTMLQIKIWKQQKTLHERTWKRQQTLYGMLNAITGQLQRIENGMYGYRESGNSPILHTSHADLQKTHLTGTANGRIRKKMTIISWMKRKISRKKTEISEMRIHGKIRHKRIWI